MNSSSKFNVLLYSDGSHHSLSAAVYAATLLKNMPEMNLTILLVQEKYQGSTGEDDTGWNIYDPATQKQTEEVLIKTNNIFIQKGFRVNHQVIYGSTAISDTANTIIEYARDNDCKLIIMGTRGKTDLKGLIFGSLSQSVLNRSAIPVLLIKKLPQEFVDNL